MKLVIFLFIFPLNVFARLNVVTTTPEIAWLVKEIGKEEVDVTSLLTGNEDPHFVEALPSFVAKLTRADIFCQVGLELEVAWAPKIVQMSANKKISKDALGHCEIGPSLQVLDVPKGKINRSMGDVHVGGNPHFHLSPKSMIEAAAGIEIVLAANLPEKSNEFAANTKALEIKLLKLEEEIKQKIPKNLSLYQYHKDFTYYFHTFGITQAGTIESVPGVPPSAREIATAAINAKKNAIPLALASLQASSEVLKKFEVISSSRTVKVAAMMTSEQNDYIEFMRQLTNKILTSLK